MKDFHKACLLQLSFESIGETPVLFKVAGGVRGPGPMASPGPLTC